ncbi:MAG: hypothetical protein ACI8WB_004391, partial [Phenylobacterium sp.]
FTADDKQNLIHVLRPATLFAHEGDEFRISTCIYYSTAVFFADFIIHSDGTIEMLQDEPLITNLPENNGELIG